MDTQNKKLEVLNKELENRRGFLGGSGITNLFINAGVAGLIPGSGRFPWRRKWNPTAVFLPGKSHEQRNPVGYSSWDCKRLGHSLATNSNRKEEEQSNRNEEYNN